MQRTLIIATFFLSHGAHANDKLAERELNFLEGTPAPKPANKQHTLTCATQNKSRTDSLSDAHGKQRALNYLASTDINYHDKGWEQRIPTTLDAFDFGTLNSRISYVAIDIRNVDNQPHYHYFTNSRSLKHLENWSATKGLAVMAAMQRIRYDSNLSLGANSRVKGTNKTLSIAELNHLVHLHSDNAAAVTFKYISDTDFGETFINNWLIPPTRETFASGYGASPLLKPPFKVSDATDTTKPTLTLNSATTHGSNSLSPLTLAEFVKRVGVNHRDESLLPRDFNYQNGPVSVKDVANLPRSIQNEDLEILLYGSLNEEAEWTGMSNDGYGIGSYAVPALGGKENADAKTNGMWRVFSKTGTGISSSRNTTEATYMAHICLPEFDGGREIAFYFHLTDLQTSGENTTTGRAKATQQIVKTLIPGF